MKNILKSKKKNQNKKLINNLQSYTVITFGTIIYSLGIALFTAPNNIAAGGATGIGTMLHFLFNIPIGITIIVLNIPLFIISYKKFGKKFIKKTIFATFLSSILIDTFPYILEKHYIYSPLLAAIFGGVLVGTGVGIIFLKGGTTGGADILAKLIKLKHPHLSIGTTVFILDALVVASTLFVYRNLENLLYSSILFFVCSRAIDAILFGAVRSKMLLIVTKKPKTISKRIIKEAEHGVTVIPAYGGYTEEKRTILLSVVRPNEVSLINRIVKEIDKNAFTVITDAAEVLGYGFQKL